jgi:hypothetical protein
MDTEVLDRSRVNPRDVALFVPPNLSRKAKLPLFERIAKHITGLGGKVIWHDYAAINKLPDDVIPIVGCTPQFRGYIDEWTKRKRRWIYWDRGYLRRVYATWLPRGSDMGLPGGFYRWHIGRPQMGEVFEVPDDRWRALRLDDQIKPWNKNGDAIIIADTLPDYWNLFGDPDWTKRTVNQLKQYTKRPIIVRDKESKVPLFEQLRTAHCLVAHGSIAAVESVVMGCPVFVDKLCAAALVGQTDLTKIETPVYPERQAWLNSLAYCQFHEAELVDGTLWRLIR